MLSYENKRGAFAFPRYSIVDFHSSFPGQFPMISSHLPLATAELRRLYE
jgi:hypothetical protein